MFSAFRVECTLCHYSILYDCGCHSNCCLGDGVLLQQVSTTPQVIIVCCIDHSILCGSLVIENKSCKGQRVGGYINLENVALLNIYIKFGMVFKATATCSCSTSNLTEVTPKTTQTSLFRQVMEKQLQQVE